MFSICSFPSLNFSRLLESQTHEKRFCDSEILILSCLFLFYTSMKVTGIV